MKYMIMLLAALTFSLPTATKADHTQNTPAKIQAGNINPDGELITIDAKGLVCDFCARALEKVFMKQDSVTGIDVNLDNGIILISLKNGKTMDDATITKLVTDAGYNIGSIKHAKGHAE
jgi:copper chaperone CopZ